MMKVYGTAMNDMVQQQHSSDISNEINKMIQTFTNNQ